MQICAHLRTMIMSPRGGVGELQPARLAVGGPVLKSALAAVGGSEAGVTASRYRVIYVPGGRVEKSK